MSCLLTAALTAVAIVFIIRTIAPQTVGEQLRRRLVKQLQEHYPGFDVSLRRGRYEPEIGFIFEDLQISPKVPAAASARRTQDAVAIERLIVLADTQPEKLLDKQTPFVTRRIVVDGLEITATVDDRGELSLSKLWPPPRMGPCAPRIEISRANLHFRSDREESIDVDISDVVVVSQVPSQQQSKHADQSVNRTIALRGKSSFAKSIELTAKVADGGWNLQGVIRQARLGSDLYDRLPTVVRKKIAFADGFSCSCDISFAAGQLNDQPVNYQVKTSIHGGQYEHPRLPIPISKLRGLVVCQPGGIEIKAAQGVFGDAMCRLSGVVDGYAWPSPATMNLSVDGLMLNNHIASALPLEERIKWDRVQPAGRVDVMDGRLTFRDGKWSVDSTIQCKGLNARLANFPYPVDQLVGKIEIRDGIVTCRGMTGRAGGRRLQCGFQMPVSPLVKGEKLFVIATDGPIAIDDTLIAALSPRAMPQTNLERFVRALSPRGAVHLKRATFRTGVDGKKSRSIEMDVQDGHLRYARFPYPLYNVSGNLHVEDDLITLSKFHGTNANAGQVFCDGSYLVPRLATALAPARDSALHLRFRGAKIPMDESLRSSLPASAQSTWDAISPSGVLDFVNVLISQRGAKKPLELDITAAEKEADQVTNRNLSLQPTAVPYRLDITNGIVRYDGSSVVIESVKAQHDGTRISADGGCKRDAAGQWRLLLNVHSGSRLDPNPDLIAALPGEMRNAMHQLQLRGPVSIRGRTEFQLADLRHPNTTMDWDLVLQLEGNRIGDVGPVHSMRGELSTRGRYDGKGVRGDGLVRMDSMHINELQLTSIRGPYAVQNDRLRLGGTPASTNPAQDINRSIQGRLFDGTIDLSGDVVLSSAGFDVAITLQNGQVPTLLADVGQGRSELTGSFDGELKLEGILGTTDLLKGAGSAQVTGANLYQLPLLVQLLNLLRITPTEDVAFTDADVSFGIVEEQINFSDLKMWGDLVSLHGSGTMNWRQELDLTFNTRVSPKTTFSKIMRPLSGGTRYTLWDVDVRGPLADPTVELRPLESVGQTLERIFPVKGPRNTQSPKDDALDIRNMFR